MPTKRWFLPTLVFTALAAGAIGFGATHLWDARTIGRLAAERDTAFDCRHAQSGVPPCPVIYKNTKIEWHDRIETVQTPDRKQAERIGSLSLQLAHARRTIHALEHARIVGRAFRPTGAYLVQNGSMAHPYNTADRCPSGTVVVYDAGLSGSTAVRRSGDPGVCYVRTRLRNSRLALLTRRH